MKAARSSTASADKCKGRIRNFIVISPDVSGELAAVVSVPRLCRIASASVSIGTREFHAENVNAISNPASCLANARPEAANIGHAPSGAVPQVAVNVWSGVLMTVGAIAHS